MDLPRKTSRPAKSPGRLTAVNKATLKSRSMSMGDPRAPHSSQGKASAALMTMPMLRPCQPGCMAGRLGPGRKRHHNPTPRMNTSRPAICRAAMPWASTMLASRAGTRSRASRPANNQVRRSATRRRSLTSNIITPRGTSRAKLYTSSTSQRMSGILKDPSKSPCSMVQLLNCARLLAIKIQTAVIASKAANPQPHFRSGAAGRMEG